MLYSMRLSQVYAADREFDPLPKPCWYYPHKHFRKELAARGPKPGGFECAPNEAAANQLFLYLATKGMIVWVDVDEEK